MGPFDWIIVIFIIVVVLGLALYFLNRWASKRLVEHNRLLEQTRQTVSIFVIDKKREKLQKANMPKAVMEQVPRWNRLMKMPLVKAKVGPAIHTLVCDREVFDALPVKKTVKVEVSGIYIAGMKGFKSKAERARRRKKPSVSARLKGLFSRFSKS